MKIEFNLDYRDYCDIFSSKTFLHGLQQVCTCSPAVLWFTLLAILHIFWTSGLCLTILVQVNNKGRRRIRSQIGSLTFLKFFVLEMIYSGRSQHSEPSYIILY